MAGYCLRTWHTGANSRAKDAARDRAPAKDVSGMAVSGEPRAQSARFDDVARSYDALLVLSFGGPEGMDDVIPFLENVTRGRGIPRERLKEVAEHYYHFGGF